MSWLSKLFRPTDAEVSTEPLEPCLAGLRQVAKTTARGDAAKFLRDALWGGSVPAEELLHRAREFGHAEKTTRRAKADLGIRAYRVGQGSEQRWYWIFHEMANTHAAETANGNADMATLAPLAISAEEEEAPTKWTKMPAG